VVGQGCGTARADHRGSLGHVDVSDRVATVLACSALDPGLASLVFLDLDPRLIHPLARWLADILGNDPPVIALGPNLTEESLWQRVVGDRGHADDGEGKPSWRPGWLAGYDRAPGIVVVPDLALLSPPTARAAATLTGADVAHLERSGMSVTWHPRDTWLATLRRQDAGRVAPHLLDRFALRVDAAHLMLRRDGGPILPAPDPAWVSAVRNRRRLPRFSMEAADHVVELIPPGGPGARRDLALGRLARALAALAGEPEMPPGRIERAVELMGLVAEVRRSGAASTVHQPENIATAGNGVARPARPDRTDAQLHVVAVGKPELPLSEPVDNADDAPAASTSGATGPSYQGHAFISYVREDSAKVDMLQRALEDAEIPVWRDTSSLWPGEDWRAKIRDAITHDALVFVACFSAHSVARKKSYQYEELLLAIDQLRIRRPDDPWLVPVRFDDCNVPDFALGGGRTLASIQRADLFGTGSDLAAARLVEAVKRLLR
jgi:hypothetical protein